MRPGPMVALDETLSSTPTLGPGAGAVCPLPTPSPGMVPKGEMGRDTLTGATPQLKPRLFTTARTALPANTSHHHVSLLPAPPKCLFKPTHCSANWITFHVKIDLLKQQQRQQIKTAATAKVQRRGGLGKGRIKGACMGKKLIFWFPGHESVLPILSLLGCASFPPRGPACSGQRERAWRLQNRTPVATGGPSEARLLSGWGGLEADM